MIEETRIKAQLIELELQRAFFATRCCNLASDLAVQIEKNNELERRLQETVKKKKK